MPLNSKDLDNIQELVEITVDRKIEEKGLVTKEDLKHLPSKDDFYEETGKMMAELVSNASAIASNSSKYSSS